MKSPCQIAITNLKLYYEKTSDLTLSKEELVAIHDAVYDKKFEMMFNGKQYNYKHLLQYLLMREQFQGLYCYSNIEAEILDNTTFHYTYDFFQEGIMPQSDYKMHQIATVNPNNGKIISRRIMTGQITKEFMQFNQKYVDLVEKNIDVCKTSSASTHSHHNNNHNKCVGNVPSSSASSSAGVMKKNDTRKSRNSRHLVSCILKKGSKMTTRISTILSGGK